MKKFNVGQIYHMRSACDQNCIWRYYITGRTEKTVTITDGKKAKTCRINAAVSAARDAESIFPLGRFSMAPILSADH